MEKINFIASIVSILSALFSFIMFLKNKAIRNEISERNRISKIAKFLSETNTVIHEIEKYAARNKNYLTLDFNNLIKNLRTYYKLVKDIEGTLKKQKIDTELNAIKEFTTKFANYQNNPYTNNLLEIDSIYYTVVDMDSKIKNELDQKIYL